MPEKRTRYAILGALTLGRMSGYDLKRFADQSLAHFWTESYGQIYPILKELLKEGLIREHRSGPRRTEYAITPGGKAALDEWLVRPAEHQALRIELLLKLFFARRLTSAQVRALLEEFRDQHVGRLAEFDAIESDLETRLGDHPDLPYWLMTLNYGQHVSRALIEWSDQTLKELGKQGRKRAT
jgi:PadR family transcriptional regulator AphA